MKFFTFFSALIFILLTITSYSVVALDHCSSLPHPTERVVQSVISEFKSRLTLNYLNYIQGIHKRLNDHKMVQLSELHTGRISCKSGKYAIKY